MVVEENERKYLVSNIEKNGTWEREHIVYQWFLEKSARHSMKEKIIFDLTRSKILYVRVTKEGHGNGQSQKKVEYLDIKDFHADDMIGFPFVLKRRSIKEKVFLDRFVASNGITRYLLEYEGTEFDNATLQGFAPLTDVTEDIRYYNQNMCIPFMKKDVDALNFLLDVF